ncbi:MAG: hypothetical protein HY231_08070 [Acidobacteria bacterium]|nr:hypothetical protein [Acidobacteriota bacterium]
MKYYPALLVLVAALILSSAPRAATQIHHTHIERAVISFDEPVKLLGVTLQGEYLFLHHSGMMEKHKPCIFVYAHEGGNSGKLIVSYHCQAVQRDKAEQFKVRIVRHGDAVAPEIEEVQFAGSTQGHKVPPME